MWLSTDHDRRKSGALHKLLPCGKSRQSLLWRSVMVLFITFGAPRNIVTIIWTFLNPTISVASTTYEPRTSRRAWVKIQSHCNRAKSYGLVHFESITLLCRKWPSHWAYFSKWMRVHEAVDCCIYRDTIIMRLRRYNTTDTITTVPWTTVWNTLHLFSDMS